MYGLLSSCNCRYCFDEYVAICEKNIPEEKTMEKEEAVKIIEDSNKILEEFFT